MNLSLRPLAAAALALAAATAFADTQVQDPWVRGTVAQQTATGMFARLTSTTGGKLVSAASPVAGVVEIHEMTMDGNVMRMRAIPGLDLPAGTPVAHKTGEITKIHHDAAIVLAPKPFVLVVLVRGLRGLPGFATRVNEAVIHLPAAGAQA